jgi:hypothetical protein
MALTSGGGGAQPAVGPPGDASAATEGIGVAPAARGGVRPAAARDGSAGVPLVGVCAALLPLPDRAREGYRDATVAASSAAIGTSAGRAAAASEDGRGSRAGKW